MQHTRFIFFLGFGLCSLLFHSCSTCSRQQNARDITISASDWAIDSGRIDMANKMFYALPTPIEVSVLIKNSGIGYQPALLNNPANASTYLTNSKKAINFGVYVTDLTYAGLFEQTQTVLRYKLSLQQLLEDLGLLPAVDANTLKQLEANINNKDEVLRIISETYSSCTAYLNEEDRYFLTLFILAGGWIEGMYIATSLTDENLALTQDKIKQLVMNQKLTFDLMWAAMSEVEENPDIASLMSEISGLAQIFDNIYIDQTNNTVTYNAESKSSDISSESIDNITPELYAEIKSNIQSIRHSFTNK